MAGKVRHRLEGRLGLEASGQHAGLDCPRAEGAADAKLLLLWHMGRVGWQRVRPPAGTDLCACHAALPQPPCLQVHPHRRHHPRLQAPVPGQRLPAERGRVPVDAAFGARTGDGGLAASGCPMAKSGRQRRSSGPPCPRLLENGVWANLPASTLAQFDPADLSQAPPPLLPALQTTGWLSCPFGQRGPA